MQRWATLAVLVPMLVAGCADPASPETRAPDQLDPLPDPYYGEGTCANGLLFQFVDFSATDAYLPPGFHARDPQEFLGAGVAFGQAGVFLRTLSCESPLFGPLQAAFIGIFIEAPVVPGLEPAPFNFFEVVRYGNSTSEFGGALARSGWPFLPANVTVVHDTAAGQGFDVVATVSDAEGDVASFAGILGNEVVVGAGPTRYWRQGEGGLAYIEYGGQLDSRAGPGFCRVRAGTPMAEFVGEPLIADVACPGTGDPIVAMLTDARLNATFHRLPGVFAA